MPVLAPYAKIFCGRGLASHPPGEGGRAPKWPEQEVKPQEDRREVPQRAKHSAVPYALDVEVQGRCLRVTSKNQRGNSLPILVCAQSTCSEVRGSSSWPWSVSEVGSIQSGYQR